MMTRILLTGLLASLAPVAFAGEPFAASLIPAPLVENANAVKRTEEIRYEIVPMGGARMTHHWVVTVLNEAGKPAASFREFYGKLFRFESVEGALYDAQGKVLRRLKPKEVGDQSAVSDGSLMTDTRVRFHDFDYPSYPYTVEYTVETSSRATLFLPNWMPQDDEQLSVEKSSITIATPPGFNYRFKAFKYSGAPVEKNGSMLERTWTAQNLPAMELPFAAPLWRELTPMVVFSADRFIYGDYSGSGESWASFGSFIASLNKGRDELPPALQQKVHAIADGIADPREKVRQLYRFLQQNTRYISIQMGVGGLQTFEARFVAEKGYGDCKALSNYMYSILKEAGVPAHYAVINSGERASDRDLIEELPFSQFDHVVVCVPFPKDSLWLECTSQITPPGYMGSFTGNRKALLVTPEGGRLAATPRYTYRDNVQQRHVSGSINAEGHLEAKTRTLFRAEQQDDLAGFVQTVSRERVKKYLDEHLGLSSTYEVLDFRYEPRAAELPELTEQLTLFVANYATVSGKRLFITPNFANKTQLQLSEEKRNLPICLRDNYSDTDSVELTVPEGYTVETLPKPVQLRTPYGNYSVTCTFTGNKLLYVRQRESWAGTFPATDWDKVKAFYNAVYKADRSGAVLVKQ
ncbi:DUF3857 domain-containing protein [Flaviaesturariibacter flavus]|uniref:DUF3857 domain-containing protein n=1 Tax=Flaviaesturariibacter flavus TaxID=2502780 RepID=A0A4R1B6S3_9BACT|nr:DUF3857 domain-containing transglutaminase family protein [Flaviaesturariibacter flavus]TCJ12447.1 DUF3857 domain-containing protein [Flaviaesturariibacter flavus]